MRMKRIAVALAAAALGIAAPASAQHGTTVSGLYVGPGNPFVEAGCSAPATGIVCFDVGEAGLSRIHAEIDDVSTIPMAMYVQVEFAGGGSTASRICVAGDIPVPNGVTVSRVVANIEIFGGGVPCGAAGEFHLPTAGEVRVTYF